MDTPSLESLAERLALLERFQEHQWAINTGVDAAREMLMLCVRMHGEIVKEVQAERAHLTKIIEMYDDNMRWYDNLHEQVVNTLAALQELLERRPSCQPSP